MFFFSKFPKLEYIINGNKKVTAIDITKRFTLIQTRLKNKIVYYTYTIKDSDTPISVANKYYKDSSLDWFLFLINQMYDPYFDWPLTHRQLVKYIRKKYGSVADAKQQIAEYYQILQPREVLYDGTIIEEKKVLIDLAAYNQLVASERSSISFYDLEVKLNDAKRELKLIDRSYLPIMLREFENTFV